MYVIYYNSSIILITSFIKIINQVTKKKKEKKEKYEE